MICPAVCTTHSLCHFNILPVCSPHYDIVYEMPVFGTGMHPGCYKDITHQTHTIIFTNSKKRASGFTPVVFQGMYFEVFISFVHCIGIIIKEKCSPFNQGIIQQPIMYINKVITPMTELSEPPSYIRWSFWTISRV